MKTPLKGFPTRYANNVPDDSGPWFDAAQKVFKCLTQGGIVMLYGGRGTGKTYMAYDLARQGEKYPDPTFPKEGAYTDPRPAIYRTAMRVFLDIRDTFRKDSEKSELEVMTELFEAVLLVIDEIQERGESRFEDQKLTAVIDARYQHGRPTILIGNYDDHDSFAASVSPSILSRMTECGGLIACNWPSFRA